MDDEGIYITEEGLAKLEAELKRLVTVERREVAERIRQSHQFNESVEDLDFEDAKNQQGFIEGRIAELQVLLQRAEVVERSNIPTKYVGVGSEVELFDLDTKETFVYRIVGAIEADPMADLISYTSPVGQALMDCEAGDEVEIKVPAGVVRYRIEKIRKPPLKRSSASREPAAPEKDIASTTKTSLKATPKNGQSKPAAKASHGDKSAARKR